MNLWFKFCALVILFIAIVSCSEKATPVSYEMSGIGISLEKLNTEFTLSAPGRLNTFKIGDDVTLQIKVVSKNRIAFGRNSGARIFTPVDNIWKEIPDIMGYVYLQSDLFVYDPYDNNPQNFGYTSLIPQVPDPTKSILVRIFLIGFIFTEGQITDEKAAAYVDVVLKPK